VLCTTGNIAPWWYFSEFFASFIIGGVESFKTTNVVQVPYVQFMFFAGRTVVQ
jgi:hypothetical protein